MRRSDLQADALSFMYAHEFVEQTVDEADLYNPLEHSIEYPTRAPLSDKIIDRNEVAEKVIFCTLADLAAQRRLILTLQPVERLLGQRWLARTAQAFGGARRQLLAQRDGSFPNSPINQALNAVFDEQWRPGSDFISEPRLPVRRLIKLLFKARHQETEEEREPYSEVLRWVGDVLIDEGYYIESTDVTIGMVPFKEAHPDKEKMIAAGERVREMRERLARFERTEPELHRTLKDTVSATMKELAVLHSRRYTL